MTPTARAESSEERPVPNHHPCRSWCGCAIVQARTSVAAPVRWTGCSVAEPEREALGASHPFSPGPQQFVTVTK